MDQELFKLIQISYQVTDSTFLLDTDFILEQQDHLYLLKISTNQKFRLNYTLEFDKITGLAKYGQNTYYLIEQYSNVAQIYRISISNSFAVIRLIYKTQMQRFCYQMNDLKDRRVRQHKTRIHPGYFKYQEVYVPLHQNGLLHPMQNLVKFKEQDAGFIGKYFVNLRKDSLLISLENQVLRLDQLAEEEENQVIQQIRLPTEQVTLRNGLLKVEGQLYQLQ